MGWFGKGKKELAAEQVESQNLAQWAQEHDWVSQLTTPVAKKYFSELFTAFDEVKKFSFRARNPNDEIINHNERLLPQVKAVEEAWLAVDRSQLSLEDAHTLFEVLQETLPTIAGNYNTMAGTTSMVAAMFGYHQSNRDDRNSHMIYPEEKQIIAQVDSCFEIVSRIRQKQWKDDYASRVPKADLMFPMSLKSNRAVKAAAVRLHKLWVVAGEKQLSVEDQYFVDEVAARYVPDAVKAVQAFSDSSEVMQQEAHSILLDQLSLMSSRLEGIVAAKQEGSLQELRAQASFLREVAGSSVGAGS